VSPSSGGAKIASDSCTLLCSGCARPLGKIVDGRLALPHGYEVAASGTWRPSGRLRAAYVRAVSPPRDREGEPPDARSFLGGADALAPLDGRRIECLHCGLDLRPTVRARAAAAREKM
jgi:hypothetical protein